MKAFVVHAHAEPKSLNGALFRTRARVELGRTYPHPIIRHATAREVALEAFARLKSGAG